jgi:hypothetical protein
MQRWLGASQTVTHYSQFDQLLTHLSQNFRTTKTERRADYRKDNMPFQRHIFFCDCIKGKPHKYGKKMFRLCEAKSGYIYNLEVCAGPHPTNRNTTWHSVLLTGCVTK